MHRYLWPVALVATAAVVLLAPAAGQAGSAPAIGWSWTPPPPLGSSYAFGAVASGQTASATLTLSNSGGSATGALTVALSGPDATAFSITADACTATALGKGKSCNVSVQFAPTTAGQSYNATLTATGKKPAGGGATITLTGSGQVTNHPPVANPDTFNMNEDDAFNAGGHALFLGNILANDTDQDGTDQDGDQLTVFSCAALGIQSNSAAFNGATLLQTSACSFQINNSGSIATVVIMSDGSVVLVDQNHLFDPLNNGEVATVSIGYTAIDTHGAHSTQTQLNIVIHGVSDSA